ncbi:MAG: glucose-1-phosphate adenylyltransferase [Verrucomicrobiae bacterium]|nr:glucose-1-phosphate adenylyltransferase [Verrucomicrobiae bacterium]MCP5522948.1 glucose-1-phosphate adenylyltransferase [Verrucomicrobiales bacterium]
MNAPNALCTEPSKVLSIIMGGGAGTRLFPLTLERAKPAVPLAGKYRLVDIPISNCINSGMRRIYLLTQFNSASLHRHVYGSFKFDSFTHGFVEILAAEQTPTSDTWYQGTADAVRKNRIHFRNQDFEHALILSGDQLYRMDFREILSQHVQSGAELTIATTPVGRADAQSLGIMQTEPSLRISRFVEKPKDPAILNELAVPEAACAEYGMPTGREQFLASMGIYVFNRDLLFEVLENDHTDFGKHIIPETIATHRVHAFISHGYWEDIGTIRSFFEANIDLTSELPRFNFFDMTAPIYTRPRFLPASKINGATVDHCVVADGCILNHCRITQCVMGLRTLVDQGSTLRRCVVMGADRHESKESIDRHGQAGLPRVGIGRNTVIENAIIDKNTRIGDGCIITPEGKPDHMDGENFYVRDGIMIIPKGAVIPHGSKL